MEQDKNLTDGDKAWKINGEKEILSTKIFDVYKLDCYLPSKKIGSEFISIHTNDWVNTFAVTDDDRVILVRQHRLGKNIVTLEVPAGAVNRGEKPEIASMRELEEETGYVPGKLILMKSIPVNPAIQDNTCHFFLALDCRKSKEPVLDPTEELEVVFKERAEVFDSIFGSNLFENSVTLLSIVLAKEYLRDNPS
jgi:ADP-ribose pyrophosphatase